MPYSCRFPVSPKPPPRHLPVPSVTSPSLSVSLSFPVPSFPTNAVPSVLSSRLAPFPSHEAFGARPSRRRAPGFIPLWGCIIAHGVRAPHWFALLWARGHLGRVHLLAVRKDAAVSVPAQVFAWTNGFVSLGSAPRSRSSPSHASGVFHVRGTAAPFDVPTSRALASRLSTFSWPPALDRGSSCPRGEQGRLTGALPCVSLMTGEPSISSQAGWPFVFVLWRKICSDLFVMGFCLFMISLSWMSLLA